MVRIGFLSLLLCCLYLLFDREELFAYSVGLNQNDTILGQRAKDTLQLDTAQIIRKNLSAKEKLDQKKSEYGEELLLI